MALYKTFKTMSGDYQEPDPAALASIPVIKSSQQRQDIIQQNILVVVDNYTTWCGPCKQCEPGFAALAQKHAKSGVCALVKENADDKLGGWPEQIRGVPCFHFYMNGQFLSDQTITGADVAAVGQTIERLLS